MKTILQKLLITLVTISTFSQASENNMFVFQTTDVKIDDSKAQNIIDIIHEELGSLKIIYGSLVDIPSASKLKKEIDDILKVQ